MANVDKQKELLLMFNIMRTRVPAQLAASIQTAEGAMATLEGGPATAVPRTPSGPQAQKASAATPTGVARQQEPRSQRPVSIIGPAAATAGADGASVAAFSDATATRKATSDVAMAAAVAFAASELDQLAAAFLESQPQQSGASPGPQRRRPDLGPQLSEPTAGMPTSTRLSSYLSSPASPLYGSPHASSPDAAAAATAAAAAPTATAAAHSPIRRRDSSVAYNSPGAAISAISGHHRPRRVATHSLLQLPRVITHISFNQLCSPVGSPQRNWQDGAASAEPEDGIEAALAALHCSDVPTTCAGGRQAAGAAARSLSGLGAQLEGSGPGSGSAEERVTAGGYGAGGGGGSGSGGGAGASLPLLKQVAGLRSRLSAASESALGGRLGRSILVDEERVRKLRAVMAELEAECEEGGATATAAAGGGGTGGTGGGGAATASSLPLLASSYSSSQVEGLGAALASAASVPLPLPPAQERRLRPMDLERRLLSKSVDHAGLGSESGSGPGTGSGGTCGLTGSPPGNKFTRLSLAGLSGLNGGSGGRGGGGREEDGLPSPGGCHDGDFDVDLEMWAAQNTAGMDPEVLAATVEQRRAVLRLAAMRDKLLRRSGVGRGGGGSGENLGPVAVAAAAGVAAGWSWTAAGGASDSLAAMVRQVEKLPHIDPDSAKDPMYRQMLKGRLGRQGTRESVDAVAEAMKEMSISDQHKTWKPAK